MSLSVEVLQLIATILPGHADELVQTGMHGDALRVVSAVIGVIKQMKECKVRLPPLPFSPHLNPLG